MDISVSSKSRPPLQLTSCAQQGFTVIMIPPKTISLCRTLVPQAHTSPYEAIQTQISAKPAQWVTTALKALSHRFLALQAYTVLCKLPLPRSIGALQECS